MFLPGVQLTCASGHKKSEVEFQLCRCAFLESGCTQVQSWPVPGEANRGSPVGPGGPYQYYAVQQYSVVRRVWGQVGLPSS